MSTHLVRLGSGTIKTTIATTRELVDEGVKALLSNSNNYNRSIGVDVIMKQRPNSFPASSTVVLLQLSDGVQCLIVQLQCFFQVLPESLYNFLSLPAFTFAGIGIKETMSTLKKDFGLRCKNTLKVGPSGWHQARTGVMSLTLKSMVIPAFTSISGRWDAGNYLTEEMISLDVSNAFAAFSLGEKILNSYV